MTCRVARVVDPPTKIKPVSCMKCSAKDLDVFFTSKTLGLHVCPICAEAMIGSDVKEGMGFPA